MTRTIIVSATVVFLMIAMAFTTDKNDITGNWKATGIETSSIKVYKAMDGIIYGKIEESNNIDWIGETMLKNA